ncbi:methanobactin biosynthesis protein MbnB [Candidatus Methylospira mobilis]
MTFTQGSTLEMVRQMVGEGEVDYVEFLIDNFLHVPVKEVAEAFDCPVGFHIMHSRFLESDEDHLISFAKRLREFIDAMKPLYVSDHLAHFSNPKGRQLYHLAELDYQRDYERVRQKVEWWQEQLRQPLYLENFPSIMDSGADAPEFFMRLAKETGSETLFDASNAVCAYLNCGLALDSWENVIDSTLHYHVASYRQSLTENPSVIVDSHDGLMSEETLGFLAGYKKRFEKPGATMTYERDQNIEYDSIVSDIRKLRAVFCDTEGAAA